MCWLCCWSAAASFFPFAPASRFLEAIAKWEKNGDWILPTCRTVFYQLAEWDLSNLPILRLTNVLLMLYVSKNNKLKKSRVCLCDAKQRPPSHSWHIRGYVIWGEMSSRRNGERDISLKVITSCWTKEVAVSGGSNGEFEVQTLFPSSDGYGVTLFLSWKKAP